MLLPPKWNTFIITPTLTTNIDRCLETLYKYTEKDSFYVYVIDQSIWGIEANTLRNKYPNLMIIRTPKSNLHHTGNLGFAQANNLGISLVQTPYFTLLNDDVEFINDKWWQGVLDTFQQVEEATPDSPAVIVCPASIRLADWSVGRKEGDDFDIISYKDEYNDTDWDFLINKEHYVNKHLTIQPDSVFDGVTMYACVCDTQRFLQIGMLDEKYFPGSGEDYDYSCRARMMGFRSVSTTKSWVFHHWSSTFRALKQEKASIKDLQIPELNWNNNHEKWGDGFNIWGIQCQKCKENGRDNTLQIDKNNVTIATCSIHPDETYQMPDTISMPL